MLKVDDIVILENGDIDYIKHISPTNKDCLLDYIRKYIPSSKLKALSDEAFKERTADYKFSIGDIVVEYDPEESMPWSSNKTLCSGAIERIVIKNGEAFYKIKGQEEYFEVNKLHKALVQSETELLCLKKKGKKIFTEDKLLELTRIPLQRKTLEEIYLPDEIVRNVHNFKNLYHDADNMKKKGIEDIRPNILMSGPPGNGKTILAGAIAEELNLPMYIADMSKIRARFVGSAGENIGILFDMIQQLNNTGCVLFLDECDTLATTRMYGQGSEKDDSATLNIMLTKIDSLSNKVVGVAATNFKDELDEAFSRRFTLLLYLNKPNDSSIQKYVYDYFKKQEEKQKVKFCSDDIEEIIQTAKGQSWSRIDELCSNHLRETILGKGYSLDNGWVGLNEKKKIVMGFCGK